jgi:hypothetical protein
MATKSKKSPAPASSEAESAPPSDSAMAEIAAASPESVPDAAPVAEAAPVPETAPVLDPEPVPEAIPEVAPVLEAAVKSSPLAAFSPAAFSQAAFSQARAPRFDLAALADLGRENAAALAKSNLALSEGLQAIGEEVLGYARLSFESASKTAKALLGAKTLDEVIKLNSDLARTSFETMMARSARLSEMSVTVANETLAPLGGRVEATISKMTKAVAA